MADTGIHISEEDKNAYTSTGTDLLLDMDSPLAKLDSSNDVSFQNILLTFNTEPPNPDGVTSFNRDTEVYRFKHGYSYIPATWMMYQNLTPDSVGSVAYSTIGGVIASPDAGSAAYLFYYVDSTYVHIVVRKSFQSGVGSGVTAIIGYRLRIRIYVFAEDIGV